MLENISLVEAGSEPAVTEEERNAFLWMQGRLVELLLRYNVAQFGSTFGEYVADPFDTNEDERLKRYRDLAVVIYLQEELFNHILPRIKRRLSFVAPRQTNIEPLPGKGRVDWSRTAAANWRERPGEAPLEVHTHQRRRNFATPENLLTVVTVLEYRQQVQGLLDNEIELNSAQALRHPLNEIVEQCGRELAFLQFAGLVAQCEEIVSGYSPLTTEELEEQVRENLLPGHNSAYAELLDWRARLSGLSLLERTSSTNSPQTMLGADPQRDNYLYQLWLFYEMGHLLEEAGRLEEWDQAKAALTFSWGEGEEVRKYRLQHDQAIRLGEASKTYNYWDNAPGVRPDFYIQPVDQQVATDQAEQLLWHEPGYVLDAKYYKPRGSLKAPASPVKRMIADLQLTGERYGALLFAFQKGAASPDGNNSRPNAKAEDDEENSEVQNLLGKNNSTGNLLYEVVPQPGSAQFIQPDVQIGVWRLRPGVSDEAIFRETLLSLFNQVHSRLKTRVEVQCRGIFLDSLSANGHGKLADVSQFVQRGGQPWPATAQGIETGLDDLLLCPKPHIAPWRVDLVSRSRDCCQNAQLCHVLGQKGITKPQRLMALDEIKAAIRFSGDTSTNESDEEVAQVATKQVLIITRRYADLLKPDMQQFEEWLRASLDIDDLYDTSVLLTPTHKETLALARFLAVQVEAIRADNYAGPALLFTGTLEEIVRATIYKVNGPIYPNNGNKPLQATLGTVAGCYTYGGSEWSHLENKVNSHWYSNIEPGQTLSFEQWIKKLAVVVQTRNTTAHSAHIQRSSYNTLTNQLFGSPRGGMGVLNGLLLAWHF